MNILPKKSWHVRTKKNIERVRRDEAQAAEEEKELKRRIHLAEQEARTDLLRKRAKGISGQSEQLSAHFEKEHVNLKEHENLKEHVNFFRDIEENGLVSGKNAEHEAEEKARKEKFEKDLGILTYLGQSCSQAKGETPFYLKSSFMKDDNGEDGTKSEKHKTQIDPLNEMKKYIAMKGKKYLEPLKPKKQEKGPEEKKLPSCSKKMTKVEELRTKRIKRELEERNRSQKFLEELRKGPASTQKVIVDDRLRKYNSQFNPHLARNNLERPCKFK